jgi:hypothetical protein
MNVFSKIILISTFFLVDAYAQIAGEPCCIEPWMASRNDIAFFGGFESDSLSMIGTDLWNNKWGIGFSNRIENATIINDPQGFLGKVLRVSYPKGKFGPQETGIQFPIAFEHIERMTKKRFDSLYIRYYVQFENGFDFKLGGKLPGIMGCTESWARSGGSRPNGANGWTLRLMWRKNGNAVVYAYLPPHKYGGVQWGLDIDLNRQFKAGLWYCIEQFVKINEIGKENGVLKVWINEEEVLSLDDVLYRKVDNDAGKIGGIYVSTFHGGNNIDWAPDNDSYALFDGFTAAKEKRIASYKKNSEIAKVKSSEKLSREPKASK